CHALLDQRERLIEIAELVAAHLQRKAPDRARRHVGGERRHARRREPRRGGGASLVSPAFHGCSPTFFRSIQPSTVSPSATATVPLSAPIYDCATNSP